MLEQPLDNKIQNPKEDFFLWSVGPMKIGLKNMEWQYVKIHQEYSLDDDAHIQVLITYFKDSRYITVGGNLYL
jgi:hypothetical protein